MGRVMALDVGSVRIGIALSDILRTISSPYQSYRRVNINSDIAHIKSTISANEVDVIVVGMPLSMDGKENAQSLTTRAFADKLAASISIPIVFVDERFTTLSANRLLLEADMRRSDRKSVVDKVAASFILQNYLDKHS